MHPNQGKPLWLIGHQLISVKTTGDYALADVRLTPNVPGPPPHYHTEADELYYVLEGTVEFMRGGEWHAVEEGESFLVSKGTLHSFRAAGDAPGRFLTIHDPGEAMDTLFLNHGVPVEEEDGFERSVSDKAIGAFVADSAEHDMIIVLPEPA